MTGGSVSNNTAESNGGGIYFEGTNVGESILWLDGTTLSGNVASSADQNVDSRRGGGLYMTDDGNRLVFNNVTVADNSTNGRNASDGGGLAFAGADHTIDITGGSIVRNTAGGPIGTDSDGGGFWNAAFRSEFTFDGVMIGGAGNGNISTDDGGGFFSEGRYNTLNFIDTTFEENQADDNGGAFLIANDSETINISGDSQIINNRTLFSHGGGFNSGGQVNIIGTAANPIEITGNRAGLNRTGFADAVGGGFFSNNNGTVTLTDVQVDNNTAYSRGGGFFVNGGGRVIVNSSTPGTFRSSISSNTVLSDDDNGVGQSWRNYGNGGGFFIETANSLVDLTDTVVADNTVVDEGGGFYQISNDSQVRLTRVDITGNVAQDNGGGFRNASNGATVTMDTVLIDGNRSETEHGGGFLNSGVVNGSNVTITNNKVGVNLADVSTSTSDLVGGAFYNSAGRMNLVDATIEDNYARGRGGGFYTSGGGIVRISSSDPGAFRSTISNNSVNANSNDGGGFWVGDAGTLVDLDGVDVVGNSAGDQGGGFRVGSDNARVQLTDVTIDGNNAGSHGGGFRNESAWSVVELDNVSIINNTTTNHHGGGFWNRGSVIGQDVIIDGNRNATAQAAADSNDNNVGGGFWNNGDGAYVDLTRVEITNNESHGRGGGIYNDSRAELRLTDFIIQWQLHRPGYQRKPGPRWRYLEQQRCRCLPESRGGFREYLLRTRRGYLLAGERIDHPCHQRHLQWQPGRGGSRRGFRGQHGRWRPVGAEQRRHGVSRPHHLHRQLRHAGQCRHRRRFSG